jgi:hypothetical protein
MMSKPQGFWMGSQQPWAHFAVAPYALKRFNIASNHQANPKFLTAYHD